MTATASTRRRWLPVYIALFVNGLVMLAFWSDRPLFGGRQHLMEGILLGIGCVAVIAAIWTLWRAFGKTSS
jgi:hypothetical protein